MKLRVGKYAISPPKMVAGTKGSYGFEELEFLFDPFWDTLCKRIVFECGEERQRVSLWIEEGKPLLLPREVTATAGVCRFSVIGYRNERIIITLAGELIVLDTLTPEGTEPVPPSPDLLAQLAARLDTLGREQQALWQAMYELQKRISTVREQRKGPSRARADAAMGEAKITAFAAPDGAEEAPGD